jgi:SAM-dependent methyltransferase
MMAMPAHDCRGRKVRDSGMPGEQVWTTFFDAGRILTQLGLDDPSADVVEFGCGYGTFTVAAAARTRGTVFALDIEPAMVEATQRKARELDLKNVRVTLRDFAADGTGLADDSVGGAMLFNILHAENPVGLLREAYRVLRPGGKVGVIHWNYDPATPRGPDLSIRPRPEQCRQWLGEAGFDVAIPFVSLPPHHYGLVGQKPTKASPSGPRLT